MGRPPPPAPVARKSITLPQSMWDAVNDFRFAERIGSEAEAVRRLLQAGLDAEERKAARRRK